MMGRTQLAPAAASLLPLLLLLLAAASQGCHGYPEYRAELPNIPTVNGAAWEGVGHLTASGGGLRNAFGRDFAAAGHTWTKELCSADSDGDGHTNGEELGDPHCQWRKGQPSPVPSRTSLSHPGLKQSVPQLLSAAKLPAAPSSASRASSDQPAASASLAAPAEPNADMLVPHGSERNLNGDKPQRWCEQRRAAAQQAAGGDSAAGRRVGRDQQWLNISLPAMTVLGTPDTYSCHPIRIPDSVPDAREFVGVRVGLDGASHLHHVLLMECPADLWFIQDITRNSEMCTTHSGSMFNACNRWWVATEADNDYTMCTPPGLIYARAGEMRAHNKVLVLQIHWVFGAKLLNQSVTLANASLNLLHEDTPAAGPATHIMETMEGTAVYPPSLMQHVNGLVIPGGQDAYTARYSCAKRCTYVPLGGLSPRPVHIAGYTFHGHHFMQSMHISIKRCPLHSRLPDVSWEVTDWTQSVVHPTYDTTGQGIQLFPGDTLSWSCTYNTSAVNRTIYGGYAGYSEEMCIMILHYYPRNMLLRGCSAVSPEQGGHSVCMYEGAQLIAWQNSEANRVPIRTVLSPRSLPLLGHGQPSGLNPGYKASVVIAWTLIITAFLCGTSALLARCRALGPLHAAYTRAPVAVQRNIPVYLLHILFDTAILVVWAEPLFAGWCGCTETGPSNVWLLGVLLLFITTSYAIELVWRQRIGTMLALHHVVTILIIASLLGEAAAKLYQVADAMILLGAFAVLEQPTFVALLLQRVLPGSSVHVVRAWRVAVPFWFASKTLSLVLAVAFIVRDWALMPTWVHAAYCCIWAVVYSIQVWSGLIQRGILRSVVRKYEGRELLPGGCEAGGLLHSADSCGSLRDSSSGELVGLECSIIELSGQGKDGKHV